MYAGGVHVHVVGAVCNRPLGVAVYGHIVGAIACARGRLQIALTKLEQAEKWTKTLKFLPPKMARHSLK